MVRVGEDDFPAVAVPGRAGRVANTLQYPREGLVGEVHPEVRRDAERAYHDGILSKELELRGDGSGEASSDVCEDVAGVERSPTFNVLLGFSQLRQEVLDLPLLVLWLVGTLI